LKFMRASIKMIGVSNLQSFIASMTQKLTLSDISDESKNYLDKAGITTACLRIKSKWTCGISTLSQSPMLGFHKQMDNRIKLLEEILSFRMQGVEFDNGDMYVDGHKAASDVRDEFVSVTEKLMDELAQCYNVLPQLDINNTIDHRP